jgi:hypothetical protein
LKFGLVAINIFNLVANDYKLHVVANKMVTFCLISISVLHPIPPLGAFEKWGIDLIGPFLVTPQANIFLVVATSYLTKWAEIKPLKTSKK